MQSAASLHIPAMGTITAFPGASLNSVAGARPASQCAASVQLSYAEIGELLYACLPPTEGWQPFRYINWFSDRGIQLPQVAMRALTSDNTFDPTTGKSYLVTAVRTSRLQADERRYRNFEVFAMRRHLHEMPLEAVLWMMRSLVLSELPEHIGWMLAMHEPIVDDGVSYRLSFCSRRLDEPPERACPLVNTCVVSPNGLLNGYGAVCFVHGD